MKKILIFSFILFFFSGIFAQTDIETAGNLMSKAKKYYEFVNFDSASIDYTIAARIFSEKKRIDEFFDCQIGIGQCLVKKNNYSEAEDFFEKLQKTTDKKFGKENKYSASCYHYKSYAQIYLYKFPEAEENLKSALALRIKLTGELNIEVGNSYNLYGQLYTMKGNYQKALEYYQKALKIFTETGGQRQRETAQVLNNISAIYYYEEQTDSAITTAEQSLKIKEQNLEPEHPDLIQSYNSLAVYQNAKKKYSEALKYHLKNVVLAEKYYGKNNSTTATVYQNIGITYYYLKNYEQALEYLKRAYEIKKIQNQGENLDAAGIFINLGDVYDELYDFDKALNLKKQAIEIYQKVLGNEHPNLATAYNSIAITYKNSGNFKSAVDFYGKALEIYKNSEGDTGIDAAMCYTNIGAVYAQLNQNQQSLEYYQHALNIYLENYGEDAYETALIYNNIGEVYNQNSETEKAKTYFKKAIKIHQKLEGENSEQVAILLKNIGNSYEFSGKYDDALNYYRQALEISKKTEGENCLNYAVMTENISKICIEKSDFESAKKYSEQTLKIRQSLLPKTHFTLSYSYCDIAYAERKLNNYTEALKNYSLALECNLPNYSIADGNYFKTPEIINYQDISLVLDALKGKILTFVETYFNNKSDLQYKQRCADAALEYLKVCDQTIDLLRKSSQNESDKILISESSGDVYNLALNFCHLLNLNTGKKEYLETAFYYSEKLKAGILLEALAGANAMKFSNIPDSLIAKEKTLDKTIADYKKKFAEKNYEDKDIQDLLFKSEKEKQDLIRYCETKYAKYFRLKYSVKVPTVAEIQKKLDKNTAILSYSQTKDRIFNIILTKNDIQLFAVDKFEDFDNSVNQFRNSIINGDLPQNEEVYRDLAFQFYQTLFPCKLNKNIKKLIIIPDGNLAYIPFETLLTTKVSENLKYSEYPYLIKQFVVSYSYSANLFFLTEDKEKQKEVGLSQINDWLAFAPVFPNNYSAGISMRTRSVLNSFENQSDTTRTRGKLLNGNFVVSLPGSENEVKDIYSVFESKQKKAVVKLFGDADEKYVKSGDLRNYKYIHFATHGFVNAEKPELSGILLAQDSLGGNDGILFSGEIYGLELNADLVVLSACETGLGKILPGEGIIGLTRALLYAGAKNCIVSLWQVSDLATSKLMTEFYRNLLGSKNQKEFAEHLQKAKLSLIADDKFAHPFFWSPFILIGK